MGSKSDDWGLRRRGEDAEPKGEKGGPGVGGKVTDNPSTGKVTKH